MSPLDDDDDDDDEDDSNTTATPTWTPPPVDCNYYDEDNNDVMEEEDEAEDTGATFDDDDDDPAKVDKVEENDEEDEEAQLDDDDDVSDRKPPAKKKYVQKSPRSVHSDDLHDTESEEEEDNQDSNWDEESTEEEIDEDSDDFQNYFDAEDDDDSASDKKGGGVGRRNSMSTTKIRQCRRTQVSYYESDDEDENNECSDDDSKDAEGTNEDCDSQRDDDIDFFSTTQENDNDDNPEDDDEVDDHCGNPPTKKRKKITPGTTCKGSNVAKIVTPESNKAIHGASAAATTQGMKMPPAMKLNWGPPAGVVPPSGAAITQDTSNQKPSSGWGTPIAPSQTRVAIALSSSSSQGTSNAGWRTPAKVSPQIRSTQNSSLDQINGSSSATSSWGTPTVLPAPASRVNSPPETSNTETASGWGKPATRSQSHSTAIGMSNEGAPSAGWGKPATSQSLSTRSSMLDKARTESLDSSPVVTWQRSSSRNNGIHKASFPAPLNYKRKKEMAYVVESSGVLYEQKEVKESFFLTWRFGKDNVTIVQRSLTSKTPSLKINRQLGGRESSLVVTKMVKRTNKLDALSFRAFYLDSSIDLKEELEKIADFSAFGLEPAKLASRLELLVSPAWNGGNGKPTQYYIPTTSHFMDIPEDYHDGCGFIPQELLQDLFGHGKNSACRCAIQVRIFIPSMGIYKGMLMVKRGITKILLPESMRKVEKSTKAQKSFKGAFVVIKQVFPSIHNEYLGRAINVLLNDPPKGAFKDKIKEEKREGFKDMINDLLMDCGVPESVLYEYIDTAAVDGKNRKHTYCVGVADPTGSLPPGHVFLTGIGPEAPAAVFVTRSPCTDRADGRLIPVVSVKPILMSLEDWTFLCSLHFGLIIFSKLGQPDRRSIPAQIADGDLDGDNYFVCWDDDIVCHVSSMCEVSIDAPASEPVDESVDEVVAHRGQDNNIQIKVKYHPTNRREWLNLSDVTSIEERTMVACYADEQGLRNDPGWTWVNHILKNTYIVEDVLGHRIVASSTKKTKKRKGAPVLEVQLKWKSTGNITWVPFEEKKDEIPAVLFEYARKNNLLDVKPWNSLVTKHVHEARIVRILSHSGSGKRMEMEVLYDDGDREKVNASSIDADIRLSYFEANDIELSDDERKQLTRAVRNMKSKWFESVQKHCSSVADMAERDKVMKTIHRKFKDFRIEKNPDAKFLGDAYKKALESKKHGNKISLPERLLDVVVPKSSNAAKVAKYFDLNG